jgi:amino acid adenylation domain-containing protein/non-ribosomal peptide synthase protein (TIGR01720 family)
MKDMLDQIKDLSPEKRRLLERMLSEAGVELNHAVILPQPRASNACPLSFAQQRLWVIDQLEAGSAVYNIPLAARLAGNVRHALLERALNEVVRRHEILRTTFSTIEDEPFQIIAPDRRLALPVIDLQALPAADRETAARQLAAHAAQQPFDLAHGPLLRVQLLRLAADDHILLLTLHHIVADGWSMGVLLNEVAQLYTAFATDRPAPLPELPIQYADYALWQRRWLEGAVRDQQLAYWKEQLADCPPRLELPADRPRPATQTTRGAQVLFDVPRSRRDALNQLGQQCGATLFMTLLAAFQTLLYRYTGQDDFCIGTPIANRQHAETEPLIGFFANTLALRARLGGVSGEPSFRELLQRTRDVTLAAHDHQDVPFDLLVDELRPERDGSYAPLFQVMFALQNAPVREVPLPGVSLALLPTHSATAKFDLTLVLSETAAGLEGAIEYNTDLFDEPTIARLAGHFQQLLAGIVAQPDSSIATLPLITERERQQLLIEWNDTARDYARERCIHELFEAQVERVPAAVAVVDERQALTYAELNRRANQLAHHLQALGVGPDTPIGVCLDRSADVIVSLLGILKAGGAYVPLDPTYPLERLQFMLEDSQVPIVLTRQTLRSQLLDPKSKTQNPKAIWLDTDQARIAAADDTNPSSAVTSSSLAYILYTSGSTGRPKGVCCQHQGVINLLADFERQQPLGVGDACSWWTSLNFDVAVYEIFAPLLTGGTLHIVPEAVRAESARLIEWLDAHDIQSAYLPPFMVADFAAWLQTAAQPFDLRRLLVGVEPIREPLLAAISARLPNLHILNGYGPTEATVCCTLYPVTADHAPNRNTPIGKPMANTQIYLLDRHLQPVPVGVPGELCIGGDGLARGYLNRPDLTAERFLPSPFSPPARGGSRREVIYKTGDMARWLPDGNVEFIGRTDFQVKVRGYRIELGEIEAVLNQHPEVRKSVALTWEGASAGDKRLAAYVVAAPDSSLTPEALREFARARLPDYMLPAAFMLLDALPVTANGKVDRRALPAPVWTASGAERRAPRTPTEEWLCGLWEQVLKIERVGVTDNFFELGGHSLLATQVASRVRDVFQIDLPLKQIFEAPTIAALAEKIDALRSTAAAHANPIVPLAPGETAPLSFAQQRWWFLDQLEPGTAFYNIPEAVRLHGPLDAKALSDSLNEIIRRHAVLRSTFPTINGEPRLVIVPELVLTLRTADLQGVVETERDETVRQLIRAEAQRPFDLASGPLVRATLLRVAADDHIALLTLHHSVSDGWSTAVLVKELAALYEARAAGNPSPLPELPIQYADFAYWQRQWLRGEVLDEQLAYWKQQLDGCAAALDLPTDRPRPAIQTSRGAHHPFALSGALTRALKDLSRREGATLFMTLLAAYQTLLYRYTGQADLNVGTPIANRTRAELENLIGCFVNTLVLRGRLDGVSGEPSFRELLKRTRETTLGAYAHQAVPFEKIVDAVQPERDLSRTPLFQVMFVLQNVPLPPIELPGLTLTHLQPESGVSNFDMTLVLEETADGLSGAIEYSTDLFEAATIERFADHFEVLLNSIVADPDQSIATLPLFSAAERQRLLIDWNDTAAAYAHDHCVHQLIEMQAEQTPRALAVVAGDRTVTYRELNRRANQLAHYLQKLGVGPGQLVGLCVERSIDLMLGLLGILKAGGSYVPLDPTYPPERLTFMLDDSRASVIVTQRRFVHLLADHQRALVCLDAEWRQVAQESVHHPVGAASPDQLAYVIYTSGSTGQPKGVMITHRSLANHNQAVARAFGLTPEDRVLQFATINFDTAAEEIYPTWISGATLVLPPPGLLTVDELHDLIERERLTVLDLPTAYWHAWAHELALSPRSLPPSLRLVVVGGEKALAERYAEWQQVSDGRIRWLNTYGPTEGTIIASIYEPPSGESLSAEVPLGSEVPIGRPIANAKLYVLDQRMQPAPIGVPGELHIGGLAVARGYLNQPALTAEKFIADPFSPAERLYKTGDLARYRADGNLEYLGRLDHQVKIRGFRIEPGEIETALREHPAVREAVVLAREDAPGDRRLVAYVVPDRAQLPNVAALRSFIGARLPDYLRPAVYVMLEALPMTPSHKIDRRKLPAPNQVRSEPAVEFTAPVTAEEQTLATIWSQVLGVPHVGRDANFFELGGDSILSIQVVARANQAGLHITPRQLFEQPTVARLAAVAGKARVIHAENGLVEGVTPLTPIHHWFFDQALTEPQHWNQALLLETQWPLDRAGLQATVKYWLRQHDALRLRFGRGAASWQAIIAGGSDNLPFCWIDLTRAAPTEQRLALEHHATALQRSLNLSEGPLCRIAYFDLGGTQPGRLLFVIHHLAVDGVSWRILLEDFQALYDQISHHRPVQLPPKTTSFQYWARRLEAYAQSNDVMDEVAYWQNTLDRSAAPLPLDFAEGDNVEASSDMVTVALTADETQALLRDVPAAYHTDINDALLTALAQALGRWTASSAALIDLEGHGRADVFDDVDLSRTVGWFTTLCPLQLNLKGTDQPGAALKSIKEQLRRVPQHGLGYGLLRYLSRDAAIVDQLRALPQPQVAFNYLGQFDQTLPPGSPFKPAAEPIGPAHSPRAKRYHVLEINGGVLEGQLSLDWTYSMNLHRRETIERVARDFANALRSIIAHCQAPEAGGFTPSDFNLAPIDQRQLDKLLTRLNRAPEKALP